MSDETGNRWSSFNERACVICDALFQPFRDARVTCSRKCYLVHLQIRGPQPRNPRPGEKECVTCGVSFQPYRTICVTCSMKCYRAQPHVRKANALRKARPEAQARKNAARRAKEVTPELRAQRTERNLRQYGITPEEYDAMAHAQGNVCAICGSPPTGGPKANARLHVDHDHVTGENRMLLCNRCNMGLGYFRDSAELLVKAAAYLQDHSLIPHD